MTSKTQNVGEESKKCRSFRMCLTLNDNQFKESRYNYGSTHMNSMVSTSQKLTIYTKTKKERNPSILQEKIIKPQWEK